MDACKHCSEPPAPGSQFCIVHKCCKCYSGRQPHETGGRYQSRCSKCTKRNAINALNYRKRQRDRLRQQIQAPKSAIQQLIPAAPWSGAPLPGHHCMLGVYGISQVSLQNLDIPPVQNGDIPHLPCAPVLGARYSGMQMLAPKVAGIPHERDRHVRDGQRPQLEAEPKSGPTNSAMPYLNLRLLETQAKSTLSDTTSGNGVQLRWGVPRSPESDYQQNSVCGDLGPSHTCELQSSKGSFWHLTSSNGLADALKNEATIRKVLDTISDLTRRVHEIGFEIQLELLFSLALPDSPSLVSNLCRSDITIDEGQRDGARVRAFGFFVSSFHRHRHFDLPR